jgi:hypothetical protein
VTEPPRPARPVGGQPAARLGTPTLVVTGAEDRLTPPTCGRFPAYDAVNAAIRELLARPGSASIGLAGSAV